MTPAADGVKYAESSCTNGQVAPPSVVRAMVPPKPAAQAVVALMADTLVSCSRGPRDCSIQVVPASLELKMAPMSPTPHSVLASAANKACAGAKRLPANELQVAPPSRV